MLEAFGVIRRESTETPRSRSSVGTEPDAPSWSGSAPPGVTFEGFVKGRAPLAEAIAETDALLHGCPHETFGIAWRGPSASATPVVSARRGRGLGARARRMLRDVRLRGCGGVRGRHAPPPRAPRARRSGRGAAGFAHHRLDAREILTFSDAFIGSCLRRVPHLASASPRDVSAGERRGARGGLAALSRRSR